jgi:hypothetical protein
MEPMGLSATRRAFFRAPLRQNCETANRELPPFPTLL